MGRHDGRASKKSERDSTGQRDGKYHHPPRRVASRKHMTAIRVEDLGALVGEEDAVCLFGEETADATVAVTMEETAAARAEDGRDLVSLSDASGMGRIESALEGHDSTWHLRYNRLARGEKRAIYEVRHARVPVRAQPHLDSSIVSVIPRGARVVGVSITDSDWLELAGEDDAGENVEGSRGWMLTEHPEIGTLLRRVGGIELPSTTMRLASAEDASVVNHTNLPFIRESRAFRVAHSPFVPVRDAASTAAKTVGRRAENALVRSRGRRGDWILLVDDEETEETEAVESALVDCQPETREKWMLALHPEFGQLLRRCNADGSDCLC